MFTDVTAGSVAVYADLNDLEDKLEDFCEMTESERLDFFSDYSDMKEYEERLDDICVIEDEDKREDALEELINEMVPETWDDDDNYNGSDDDSSEKDYDDDNDKNKRHDYLEDKLERYCDMTDEEKQQLRGEFIAKVRDIQLAWISPRVQMNAGIDAAEIECREGYSLVMKESNGVPMCLTADSALKMIEKGIAIPAN